MEKERLSAACVRKLSKKYCKLSWDRIHRCWGTVMPLGLTAVIAVQPRRADFARVTHDGPLWGTFCSRSITKSCNFPRLDAAPFVSLGH